MRATVTVSLPEKLKRELDKLAKEEDLLVLGSFRGVAILRPTEFWRFEREGPERRPKRGRGKA